MGVTGSTCGNAYRILQTTLSTDYCCIQHLMSAPGDLREGAGSVLGGSLSSSVHYDGPCGPVPHSHPSRCLVAVLKTYSCISVHQLGVHYVGISSNGRCIVIKRPGAGDSSVVLVYSASCCVYLLHIEVAG